MWKIFLKKGAAVTKKFSGCYERTLDIKKRIVMPPKIRDVMGCKEFILFSDPKEEFLRIYREEDWDEVTDELLYANNGVDKTKLQRKVSLNYINCEMDAQNRVVLPGRFIDRAGIIRDIVILGVGKRVEIWSKERFEKMLEDDTEPVDIQLRY